ncbi:MAG: hypothetical protein M3Y87_18840, partial [Myxococcota bacterium]|nr:hypothetical protein [Myxococcota bacterium]
MQTGRESASATDDGARKFVAPDLIRQSRDRRQSTVSQTEPWALAVGLVGLAVSDAACTLVKVTSSLRLLSWVAVALSLAACACEPALVAPDARVSDRDGGLGDAALPWVPSAPERIFAEDVSCAPLGSVGLAQAAPSVEGGFPRLLWTYALRSDPDDAAVLERAGATSVPRNLGAIEAPGGDVIVPLSPFGTVVVDANGQHRITWPTTSTTELIPPVAIGADLVAVRDETRLFVREMG